MLAFKDSLDKRLSEYTTSFFAFHNDTVQAKGHIEFAIKKFEGFHNYMDGLQSKLNKCQNNYSDLQTKIKKLNEKYVRAKKEWSEKETQYKLELSNLKLSNEKVEEEKQNLRLIVKNLMYKREKHPNAETASSIENMCRYHGYDINDLEDEIQKLQVQVESLTNERNQLSDEVFMYKFANV